MMLCRALPLLLLSVVNVAIATQVVDREVGDYDLYILVRSYSPTFCKHQACSIRPINSFTIHGLWPEYENGGWPEFCVGNASIGGAAANEDSPAMGCEWPSFIGPNERFWDHEWDKHGTCAQPKLGDRKDFMEKVLELNQKFDVNVALEAAGITPSGAWTYHTSAVQQAIKTAYGVLPVLHCHMGAVEELWMCLSLDLLPIPCPPHVSRVPSCGREVQLPAGEPVSAACSQYFPHGRQGWGLKSSVPALAPVAAAVAAILAVVAVAAIFVSRRRGTAPLGYACLPPQPSSP